MPTESFRHLHLCDLCGSLGTFSLPVLLPSLLRQNNTGSAEAMPRCVWGPAGQTATGLHLGGWCMTFGLMHSHSDSA